MLASPGPGRQIDALHRTTRIIERATQPFSIPQIVAPLAETLDWLLSDDVSDQAWLQKRDAVQRRMDLRWQDQVSRALSRSPDSSADIALKDAYHDPLRGGRAWGVELTRAYRAAVAELEPTTQEADSLLPYTEAVRSHARAVNTRDDTLVLPIVSDRALMESEWDAILSKLDVMVELALSLGGAAAVWLIGGFVRSTSGGLVLAPRLSFTPPAPGTRAKAVHVLLGTAYEEQCPALLPLVQSVRGTKPRPSDEVLSRATWHRVVVQLDIPAADYEVLNAGSWSRLERDMAGRAQAFFDDHLPKPRVLGPLPKVPRPWQPTASRAPTREPDRHSPESPKAGPPPPSVPQARGPSQSPTPPKPRSGTDLSQDAEEMRRKGMALLSTNPAAAHRYLLASTVLDNSKEDIVQALTELASKGNRS